MIGIRLIRCEIHAMHQAEKLAVIGKEKEGHPRSSGVTYRSAENVKNSPDGQTHTLAQANTAKKERIRKTNIEV